MEINVSRLKEYGELYTVLYVEDDEVIREQTQKFLGRFFKHVHIAVDGVLGLEAYQKEKYDIVVSDINMPNMNGVEMIEKIKEIKEEQIILVTSAYNDSENLLRLINLNISRFVLKPFDSKKFLIMLYNIITELHNKTQIKKMSETLQQSSQMSQAIVDSIDIGLVTFQNNELMMANTSFLRMYGFEDFDTLVLEMPQVGVLFQNFSGGIAAETNEELIAELIARPAEEHRVRILQGSEVYEYQVKLSIIDTQKDIKLLSFTDITQLHKSLTQDIHTKLPHRQVVLGTIDSMSTTQSQVYSYCIVIDHFESVLKWYGKSEAIALESEMAEKLKMIVKDLSQEDFLGYFEKNQFIILTHEDYDKTVEDAIKKLDFEHNKNINQDKNANKQQFRVKAEVKQIKLDLNKTRDELEVFLMNEFDTMLL